MRKYKLWMLVAAVCYWILCCFCLFLLVGFDAIGIMLLGAGMVFFGYWLLWLLQKKYAKLSRRLMVLFTVCVLCFCILFLITEGMVIKASQTDEESQSPYLIVLGAGVDGTRPSVSLQDRLQAALSYLEENPSSICIVSGGQGPGEDITEAACMYQWLTERGISPERILMEEQATSTQENLAFSAAIIWNRDGNLPRRVAVVSSEYHLLRALQMAEVYFEQPVGVAAETSLQYLKANYFIREVFALWKFWLIN